MEPGEGRGEWSMVKGINVKSETSGTAPLSFHVSHFTIKYRYHVVDLISAPSEA